MELEYFGLGVMLMRYGIPIVNCMRMDNNHPVYDMRMLE